MCGIACKISFNRSHNPSSHVIEKMINTIEHRGPDSKGVIVNDWVGMGFRRLSILDTSKNGDQPMHDITGQYIITINGEVYNFMTLRRTLISKGYIFQSNTDSEVVLNGYIEWGTEIFSMLQGMFAIVLYDKNKEEVIISRDQLGIKPLYFFRDNDFALFGSEIKTFKNIIDFSVNEKQLYEQLMYGYVSGKNTIFKDIYRINPGTFHRYNKNGLIEEVTYYDVTKQIYQNNYKSFNLNEIKNNLENSILQHTVSDVGYNIQLSGGVDSSYIAAVLSSQSDKPLKTYSVTLESNFDESSYQNYIVNKFNTDHHSFKFGVKDLFNNYEKATWHHDIPIVHPPSVFLMLLSRESRKNSKVILTGEGADELFGGYARYKQENKYKFYHFLKNNLLCLSLFPNINKIKNLKVFLEERKFGVDECIYFKKSLQESLFNNLNKDISYRMDMVSNFKSLQHKITASDQTTYLNWLFERQDKMSMAESVEARVPFSNHKLFNLLNSINPKYKIETTPKSILKKISQQYFDNSFIYRRKNGFVLPYDDWLRDPKGLKPWMDLISDETFSNRGYYNNKETSRMIDDHLYKNKNNAKHLLNLINFEVWSRMFIDK